jgi:hypothetical protein
MRLDDAHPGVPACGRNSPSKAFPLAADTAISNPSITRQIKP